MLDLVALAFFPGLMVFVAFSDLLTMTISNRLSIALAVGFFALAAWLQMPWNVIGWHVAAALVMLAICIVLFQFNLMGGGDGKIAAATTLWFGFEGVVNYSLATSIIGGALTLAIVMLRFARLPKVLESTAWAKRLHSETVKIPYGVALAIGALIVYPQSSIWAAVAAA